MKFSIVMPFYNKFNLCADRLRELRTHVSRELEIILVNDCSTDDVDSLVAFWQKMVEGHTIRYVKNATNVGFGRSMNRGASIADGDVYVFLSNDVRVESDFTKEIEDLLEPNIRKLIGGELLQHDTGWNMFNKTLVPYLNGWFLACHNTVWREMGGFDPRYGRYDYEDIDKSELPKSNQFRD